jgi:hypothetical protein
MRRARSFFLTLLCGVSLALDPPRARKQREPARWRIERLMRAAPVLAWMAEAWAWAQSGRALLAPAPPRLHPAIVALRDCAQLAYLIGQPDCAKSPEAQSWAVVEEGESRPLLRLSARCDSTTMREAMDAAIAALHAADVKLGRYRDVRTMTCAAARGARSFQGAEAVIALA